jgi:DNA invertase Pin-like site-specific DNA recombinase
VDDKQRRELYEAMRQDIARGRRRPADPEVIRQRRELAEDYLWVLRYGTEEQFRALLVSAGWDPAAPEFDELVRLWRQLRTA